MCTRFALRQRNIVVSILILALLIFTACKEGEIKPDPIVGAKAPNFNLTSLAGNPVSLSDYTNQVVVLFFLSYNCDGCQYGAPLVESNLVTTYASRTDFQVLGLDMGNGNEAAVETFKTATGVTFPLLMNASNVGSDYKTAYDKLIVIDKSGNITYRGNKSASGDLDEVKALVETLLGL